MTDSIFYREFSAPAVLSRHIRCVWQLSLPADPHRTDTVYPDGHCELIVHLANPMRQLDAEGHWIKQAHCIFAAQQRTAIRLSAKENVNCLGVRLQPAASAAFNDTPLVNWRDQIIDVTKIDSQFVRHFTESAQAFINDSSNGDLWALLGDRLGSYSINDRIEQAVNRLTEEEGRTTILSIVKMTQMSARSFQSKFLQQVGLGAKEFARILRLQATIKSLGSTRDSLAQLAVESGFSDQAHANREFRRITGLTPASLQHALANDQVGNETIRMAAAFVHGG